MKFTRFNVAFVAVFILLLNVPLINAWHDFAVVNNSNAKISVVILFLILRDVLCLVAAYPSGRYANIDRAVFILLFIVPSLLLIHGLIIWESNGMLELWPPILFLDIALFLPAIVSHAFGKRHRYRGQERGQAPMALP